MRYYNMISKPMTSAEQTIAHSTPELWQYSTFIPSVITQTGLMSILLTTLRANIRFRNCAFVVNEERS